MRRRAYENPKGTGLASLLSLGSPGSNEPTHQLRPWLQIPASRPPGADATADDPRITLRPRPHPAELAALGDWALP